MNISERVVKWFDEERNQDLIDEGNLTKILKVCPAAISSEILYMIMQTIPDSVTEDPTNIPMYGIKDISGSRTLSIGKHNGTSYNINNTNSQGMKGGYQIGFMSIKDAVSFIEQLPHGLEIYRVSIMQPATVKSYTWKEINSVYGSCYATTTALTQYDPIQIQQRKEANKIPSAVKRAWNKYINSIDMEELENKIFDRFPPLETLFPTADSGFTLAEGKVFLIESYRGKTYYIDVANVAARETDIPEIQQIVKDVTGLTTRVVNKYIIPDKRQAAGYIGRLWLDPQVSDKYTEIETTIKQKYGEN